MFHSIAPMHLLAASTPAQPSNTPAVGAFALLLLVIAVLALLLIIAAVIMMNHRRRADRSAGKMPVDGSAIDPWKLAGQRLNPDSRGNDRST